MATEVFSSTTYSSAWTTPSDVWVLLNPDVNQWTEQIDWELGMLLRRAFVRKSVKPQTAESQFLLLAAPEGMPAARVLVVQGESGTEDVWLRQLAPVLTKMKIKTATVFPPREWRAPLLKSVAELSAGEWGLRWVESPQL